MARTEGLVDVVARGYEEGGGEDEGEDCKCCGVEDAEYGDAGAVVDEMHDGDKGGMVVVVVVGEKYKILEVVVKTDERLLSRFPHMQYLHDC